MTDRAARRFLHLEVRMTADESSLALFFDFENIAIGLKQTRGRSFDISMVIERLLEKGRLIVKRAYADWGRYEEYKRTFHEHAVELIDIPQSRYSGKNSADIRLVVDSLALCYSNPHIDTFVVVSGDSDFSPLVSKLRESNKTVIGLGIKEASSKLLIGNCDEFIYYEDVVRPPRREPAALKGINAKKREAFELLIDSVKALMRENKEVLWSSMVKDTMRRKRPLFDEGYFGYGTFSELLKDAERHQLIQLGRDPKSGTLTVRDLLLDAEAG